MNETTNKIFKGKIIIGKSIYFYTLANNLKQTSFFSGRIVSITRDKIFDISWETSKYPKPLLKPYSKGSYQYISVFLAKLINDINVKGGINMIKQKDNEIYVTNDKNILTKEAINYIKAHDSIADALNEAVSILKSNNLLDIEQNESIEIDNNIDSCSLAEKVSMLIKKVETLEKAANIKAIKDVPDVTSDSPNVPAKSNTEIVKDILSSLSVNKNEEIAVTNDKDYLSKYLDK